MKSRTITKVLNQMLFFGRRTSPIVLVAIPRALSIITNSNPERARIGSRVGRLRCSPSLTDRWASWKCSSYDYSHRRQSSFISHRFATMRDEGQAFPNWLRQVVKAFQAKRSRIETVRDIAVSCSKTREKALDTIFEISITWFMLQCLCELNPPLYTFIGLRGGRSTFDVWLDRRTE